LSWWGVPTAQSYPVLEEVLVLNTVPCPRPQQHKKLCQFLHQVGWLVSEGQPRCNKIHEIPNIQNIEVKNKFNNLMRFSSLLGNLLEDEGEKPLLSIFLKD
jgi:hypothetical protein